MENNDAINIFDFDGTITTETWPKFWVWAKKFGYDGTKRNDDLENALAQYRAHHTGDSLETFFGFFNDLLVSNNESVSFAELMEGEQYIQYNPGIIDFLSDSSAKNYIVSGGLVAFLNNLGISGFFEEIYGTPIKTNTSGDMIGIGEIMTDDKKILAIQNILKKNKREGNDCRNVIYVGDGYSDAPTMRFVHSNGGKAIFVYRESDDALFQHNMDIYKRLEAEGIVDYCCLADYAVNQQLSDLLNRKANVRK